MTAAVHRRWDFGAPALSLCSSRNGEWVMAAMADGTASLFPAHLHAQEPKILPLYNGSSSSLAADADAHAFLSGGEDGKVLIIDPVIGETTLIAEAKGHPIACVAAVSKGERRAYGAGKTVYAMDETGKTVATVSLPQEPTTLGFSPDGSQLAMGYSGGIEILSFDAARAKPVALELKGSPCALIWSTDGGLLLAGLKEGSLKGWRLPQGEPFTREGFAGPVCSLGFTIGEKYMAASGAAGVTCWPIRERAVGELPLVLGEAGERCVTALAPHAKDALIAAGYSDGMVALAPMDGRKAMVVGLPDAAAVNGLAWNKAGDSLFASLESGTILMFTVESVRKAFVPLH